MRYREVSLNGHKLVFAVSINFLSAKKFGTIHVVFAFIKIGTLVVLSPSNHSSLVYIF